MTRNLQVTNMALFFRWKKVQLNREILKTETGYHAIFSRCFGIQRTVRESE
jgi:hypothetical protein